MHCRDCFYQSCFLTTKDLANKYCYSFPNRMTNRLFSSLELLNLLPYGHFLSEKLSGFLSGSHISTAFTALLCIYKAHAPTTSPLFSAGSDGVSLLFCVATCVVSS